MLSSNVHQLSNDYKEMTSTKRGKLPVELRTNWPRRYSDFLIRNGGQCTEPCCKHQSTSNEVEWNYILAVKIYLNSEQIIAFPTDQSNIVEFSENEAVFNTLYDTTINISIV